MLEKITDEAWITMLYSGYLMKAIIPITLIEIQGPHSSRGKPKSDWIVVSGVCEIGPMRIWGTLAQRYIKDPTRFGSLFCTMTEDKINALVQVG